MNKYVLIACECSQVVTSEFRKLGFEAYSCDLVECYGGHPEWHIIGDAAQVVQGYAQFPLQNGRWVTVPGFWDLIIAHPPCTMLTHSSAVAYSKGLHTDEDIAFARIFFLKMLYAPCRRVAVENPAPMSRAGLPPYSQIIQPWQFGHKYSKRICLWLEGLPPLLPMRAACHDHKPWLEHCAGNARRRSHFWEYVAEAMAIQWGALL